MTDGRRGVERGDATSSNSVYDSTSCKSSATEDENGGLGKLPLAESVLHSSVLIGTGHGKADGTSAETTLTHICG